MHVQTGEYGLVPQFDEDVLIVLKSPCADIINAICTIKSLFAQSYKLPKIFLSVDEEFTITDDIMPNEIAKYINSNLFIDLNNEFTLEKILNEFPDHIVLTVKNGIVYPEYWLRCVMDAYMNRNNHLQLQSDLKKLNEQLKETRGIVKLLDLELINIKKGPSFKIGRIITCFPRKVRDWLLS